MRALFCKDTLLRPFRSMRGDPDRWISRLVFLLGPWAALWMVEILNENDVFQDLAAWQVLMNMIWYYLLFALCRLILGRRRRSAAVAVTLCFLVGLLNHYILRFRGRILFPADVAGWRTAANVASPDCHGTGTVQVRRQTPMGVFATSSPCPKCGGKGRIIHQPCKDCRGSGMVRKKKTIQASIPAGIDNGQTISIRGQGNAGKNGGPAGDLLITITVRPHELFRREGTSVLCEAPITFTQAVLGAELEIPTIDGKVKYTLPEGTQSGTTFRLKGKGIPSLNGRGRGDQYVTVYIETPRNLNKEQKEALKKFADSMGEGNYEEQKKFFKKFKK